MNSPDSDGAAPTKETRAPSRDEVEHEVTFPFRTVQLFGPDGGPGERVTVRAWSVDTGAVLLPWIVRLELLVAENHKRGTALPAIVLMAKEEIKFMLCVTLNWSKDEFEARVGTWEEFLALAEAMWETSILRPGGGGALPLIESLYGRLTETFGQGLGTALVQSVSAKPSTDSSAPDTDTATSAAGGG